MNKKYNSNAEKQKAYYKRKKEKLIELDNMLGKLMAQNAMLLEEVERLSAIVNKRTLYDRHYYENVTKKKKVAHGN